MKERLFECINVSAYFLWEYTRNENALKLWYCAEDIAYYFKQNNITSVQKLNEIINNGKYDYSYINFVRNISYRIYSYTGDSKATDNWFVAEKLLKNLEWCCAEIDAANILENANKNSDILKIIKSDKIRNILYNKT